jgi:hypothetical protein
MKHWLYMTMTTFWREYISYVHDWVQLSFSHGTVIWTQGLTLVRQVLLLLEPLQQPPDPLFFNFLTKLFLFLLFILFFCWVGVHCGIYKSLYNVSNISYLNSPPPSVSFTPIPGIVSKVWFFYICIHVYTVFSPYSPFCTLSPPPLPSH